MSELTRRPRRRHGLLRMLREDRGGVTTLVAVLLGGGVLLGMGALVLDVGSLYAERETLQTSADAAAMAVGRSCGQNPTGCASTAVATAVQAASQTENDGHAGVTTVCGVLAGSALPACPPPATNLTRCLNTPSGQYVEVRVHTENADGTTVMPPILARALSGNSAYTGTTVAACARVGFGPPNSGLTPSFTLSVCEWTKMYNPGTPPPPYAFDPTSTLDINPIYLHNTTGATTCPAGPSGWDAPGGFGWLSPTGTSPCTTLITADGSYPTSTGNSAPSGCVTAMNADITNQTVLLVPVYDGVQGTGAGTTYHVKGLAAFVLTGYFFAQGNGQHVASHITGRDYCSKNDTCLYGVFFKDLIPVTGSVGGPDLGASIITLVG